VLGRQANQIDFSVAGTITIGDDCIFGLQTNLMMLVCQHRSKGVIAMIASLGRECNG